MKAVNTRISTVRRIRRTLDDAGVSLMGRRVLALCSGGSDSVALVSLLNTLPKGAAPAAIEVLFVNHGLRDDGVANERRAAQKAAHKIKAPFHEVELARTKATISNLEAKAREARYLQATLIAQQNQLDVICTGHSANDQIEQALMSLIGITGQKGRTDSIPVVRDLTQNIQLVRPLLACTREQLVDECYKSGLGWSDDPTNLDPDYAARNAVRHRVVPTLLDIRSDAGVALARAGQRERSQRKVLDELANSVVQQLVTDGDNRLDVRQLAKFDVHARRELISTWLVRAQLGRAVSTRIVVAVDKIATAPLVDASNSRIDVDKYTCVRRNRYDLIIQVNSKQRSIL